MSEVEVTQADRDAAQSILWVETLIDDREAIEQAFARHRIASEANLHRKLDVTREAFNKYARHDGLCALIGGYGYCSCGRDAALATIDGEQP